MQRKQRLFVGGLVTAALLGVAAVWSFAGAQAPNAGTFNERAMNTGSKCQDHQTAQPGGTYTAGANANTGTVLRMLSFYTANGNASFCDGKAATAADVAWARLYVDLGADAKNVQAVTGGG